MKRVLPLILASLLGGLSAVVIHDHWGDAKGSEPIPVAPTATSAPAEIRPVLRSAGGMVSAMPDFVEAAERSVNAVVHVTTETMVQRDPVMDFFWGYRAPNPQPQRGAGSGVIITNDGFIVTNNHVIDGADKIQVHLNDRRQFSAKVIGRDPSTDIALLKIEATELPTLGYGNSDEVRVGEWVLAVGNPMNLTSTVTAGIISAKARSINLLQYDPSRDIIPIESFIQTDAAVNPGNSGGALVDTQGQLIGINTAIASMTGQYAGYSFAVPVNIVKKVTADLLEFGAVQRAYMGVSIRDVDQKLANELKLERIRGVYVNGLTEGSAAKEAGMKTGDVILKVANMEVNNVPQLQEQVGRFRPGDKVTVTILREGEEKVLEMKLRGKEGATEPTKTADLSNILGADLVAATAAELKALKLNGGVKVVSVNGGKFRSSGIREGFIITRIDQQAVASPMDVTKILERKNGGVLIEGVYPNGMKAYYALGI